MKRRPVKCRVTGEKGYNDVFYKNGQSYYKDVETYLAFKREADARREFIDIICVDFFNYEKGQPFPAALKQHLKKMSFYPNEVILDTLKQNYDDIKYSISNKTFKNDSQKVSYIMAIISNNINKVYQEYKKKLREEELLKAQSEKSTLQSTDIEIKSNQKQKNKDISYFLGGDDEY